MWQFESWLGISVGMLGQYVFTTMIKMELQIPFQVESRLSMKRWGYYKWREVGK